MKFKAFLLALAFSAGSAVVAQASTVTTVSCVGDDRTFSISFSSGSASCLAFGKGNINGNVKQDPIFSLLSEGASFLAKDEGEAKGPEYLDVTGIKKTTGEFDISAPEGYHLSDGILAFKSGNNGKTTWAAFSISSDLLSGTWKIIGGQSLSHANLYGQFVEDPTAAPVPLPAAAPLLIGGIAALFGLSKRRRRAAV